MANPFDLNNFLSNYPGRDRIQELQNIDYTNNPRNMGEGTASDFRHAAAMNELSKSLSPGFVPDVVGDSLAYGLGYINEVPDMFRGVNMGQLASGIATMNPNTFKGAFQPEVIAAAQEDLAANDLGTFGTPNTATIEDVFAKTLGYQAPGNNIQTASAIGNPMGYGAAQASEIAQPQNLGFRSMVDMANDANNFDSQFVSPNRFNSMGQMGPVKSNMTAPTIDRSNVMGEDIDMGYTANSFNTQPRQGILQGLQSKIGAGFNNVKDFAINKGRMGKNLIGAGAAKFAGLPGMVGSGLMSLLSNLGNGVDYQQYTPGFDYNGLNNSMINDFFDPATGLNRFDRARKKGNTFASARTGAEYFKLRREKKAAKAQQEQAAREAATAARARARNPNVYANAGVGSGGFASQNTGTNSNFSNNTGRGRTGYQEGGLASMFTRRR